MSTQTDRDARLDALLKATKEWAEKERTALKARAASSKRMLKGRTGAERLAAKTIEGAAALLVDEIDAFLVG